MPEFRETALPGVIEIVADRFGDERGFFSETWNERLWRANGVDVSFVQDNHSLSGPVGVLRGLHFQAPPWAQAKLVRVTHGAVFDVAVDIRKGSPTYGKWVGVELSAAGWNQLFIPEGFAHGFVTLEPDTQFLYKVSSFYSREHDRSIRFDDPEIGIEWPVDPQRVILSAKDRGAPLLADCDTGFSI
ncbi:MAG: dTDP-4-dehydrorhamnose 3,5-epimerase [Zhengella sp.]|uniref:dTDP-4-dehydrorhamnose 3,5-epimerase n=1 Tax=Zhengella sp. TaxID=2282762 RepID=UPI001D54175F|nr:dTDP-4-dehydrorhamnose 3,5-epimerase [Notoacmeibacter sp.]MCC0026267.1 dTDP-4-dehydrorhamnose 3,5-epimerase [Brucellaceae bacterium]